jgi:hypothetical protein
MKWVQSSFVIVWLALGLSVTTPAQAQSLPDLGRSVTQGSQVQDILDWANARRQRAQVNDQAIDGEAGLYVLKKQDIFYIGGSLGAGYATNPLRTIDDIGGSSSIEARIDAGMQTVIRDNIDLGVGIGLESTTYDKSFAPSNSAISGSISVGKALAAMPLYLSAAGFGGWNFDEKGRNPTSFYGLTGQVSSQLPLGSRTLLQPQLVVSRVLGEVKENHVTSVGLRLSAVTQRGKFLWSATAGAAHFWYDDFYEDVTFVERQDWQYDVGAALTYRLGQRATLAGSLRYTKRDSSFFLSNYDSVDGGAAVTMRIAF